MCQEFHRSRKKEMLESFHFCSGENLKKLSAIHEVGSLMQLQPRSDNSGGLEPLGPLDPTSIQRRQVLSSSFGHEENSLLHYLQLLRKRIWWILAVLAIVFTLSVISTLRATKLYQATSKIAISPENPDMLGAKLDDNSPMYYPYQQDLETEAAMLRSDVLATRVIDTMHLDRDSRFIGLKSATSSAEDVIPTSQVETDPSRVASLVGAFHAGLSVQIIPGSQLIEVSYTHSDPRLAAEITNTLVRQFIEENFKTRYESVTQTSDWLTKELADLQLRMQASEEKLVRYERDHGILGVDDKQNIVTAKLDELNRELTAAEIDRIQKESDYRLAVEGDPSTFTKVTSERNDNVLLDTLQQKQADLNSQLAQLRTQFGSAYPKVVALNNQLKQVQADIAAEKRNMQLKLRDEYLAALEREKMLNSAFEDQKQQANELNENSIEYALLKRDADSNRQLYESLQLRLKEAGVAAGLNSSNIRVVDVAPIPTYPIAPNISRNLILGFLMGLVGGIALAFVLENMDRTVRNLEQLSGISPLPTLGVIPQFSTNGNNRKPLMAISSGDLKPESPALVAVARPKSEAAEAYRALRTAILLSGLGAPPRTILVTSPFPQEGKTTISANTALVLAQRGSRVLLVDADLRRPGLEKMLGLKSKGGLSTLLSGVDKIEDVVIRFSKVPNLWILPAGPVPPQPAELLGSQQMNEYISRWKGEFEHVIIDTPPCLSVTDATLLSPSVDRVLLVARSGQSQKAAIKRACNLLSQVHAKGMGFVLNAFDMRVDSYYYGQYATKYYSEEISSHIANSSNGNSSSSEQTVDRVS